MATVTKDFKVKSGLIVEGATATVNNYDILTKKAEDQSYIVDLIGGTATPNNTADSVVKRDSNGNFEAGVITADVIGDVTGTVSTLSNHTTNDLAEGSNLYFTNQRAVTANEGLWDEAGAAATAYSDAVADAATDATTKANAAEQSAKNYADAQDLTVISTAATDATNKANTAEDNAIAAAALDATTKANTAEQNAKAYADGLASNYDAAGSAAAALADANDYTDTAVANLVDQAPAMLDTLNELAAAIADNPNYATDVANLVATKADTSYVNDEIANAIATTTYTAGTNIDITGNVVSVTGLDSADISDFNTAAVSANTGLWDAAGSASAAQLAAEDYADGLAVNYDPAGSASTAETNANTFTTNSINALDTDDIEEGNSNLYFTDARAKDSAAALLTTATLTNLTITGTGNGGLVITAENGVADSNTDDLAEGSNNLYFTDSRAVSALEAVVPNFTEIDLNDIVTKVATQVSVPTASQITAHEFDSAVYRSAEYTVKVAYGSHTELSKVMLTLDSADNIAITEYAVVGTNGSASTITADVNAGNVRLRVTPANNNSVVTAFGTIIK